MLFLIQQLLAVVLAVDVQQLPANPPQLGHGDGPAVGPADVFPVRSDLPLEQQRSVLLRRDAVLPESRQIRKNAGEGGADKGLLRSGADQLPGCPAPQHRAHGVDDDGFARAGLAGQGVETREELNIRLFDHRDILNVKHFQHKISS